MNKFENIYTSCSQPDRDGTVYVAGFFNDSAIIANFPLHVVDPFRHMAFAKFDSSGNLLWMVNNVKCTGVADILNVECDDSGNVFINGVFKDTLFIDSSQSISEAPYLSGFFIKYDSTGTLLWKHCFNRNCNSLDLGVSGCSYLLFGSDSIVELGDSTLLFMDTTSNHTAILGAVVKFDPSGNFLFSKKLVKALTFSGAYTMQSFKSLNADNAEEILFTFSGTANFIIDTVVFVQSGNKQFITKFDSSGNLIWYHHFSEQYWSSQNLYLDQDNNIYGTLPFRDSISIGSYNFSRTDSMGVVIYKLSPSGQVIWAQAPFADSTYGLMGCVGGFGSNLIIAGGYGSPCTVYGFPLANGGLNDMFVVCLDTSGAMNWIKTIPNPGEENLWMTNFDSYGNAYLDGFAVAGSNFDSISATSVFANFEFQAKLSGGGFTTIPFVPYALNGALFPNPASEKIMVAPSDVLLDPTVRGFISDIAGRVLLNFEHAVAQQNTITLDVSFLPQGVYLVCLDTEKGKLVKKFIKK